MDEDVQLEEKKPFSDENVIDQDDQEVPDEILQLSGGDGRVWLIKVPRFLMEKWQAVTVPDIHLATMRVYNDKTNGGKNRISLLLPDAPQLGPSRTVPQQYDTDGMPKEYLLEIVNQEVENQVVISEKEMNPPKGRARMSDVVGQIHHECNVRPVFDDKYRSVVKERTAAAKEPKRKIVRLGKEDMIGGQGALNKLSSGAAPTAAFDNMVKIQQKSGKDFERFARIPRNQLLDLIFQLFEEQPSWSFKDLRAKTEQPAEYLKTVLQDVALLHRSGELNGQWTLLDSFKTGDRAVPNSSKDSSSPGLQDPNLLADTGEDGYDDDDDMEEIQ